MRITKLIGAIAILEMMLCAAQPVEAQQIGYKYDLKVLVADSLDLPPNTSVVNVLAMLPELLQRPSESLMSHYDIQLENMSLGENADAVLTELQLADIDHIEVTESSVKSYQNNGQGGCINIFLRKQRQQDKQLWGDIGLAAFTTPDIIPQAFVGYHSPKFTIRGLALGDIYNFSSSSVSNAYSNDKLTSTSTSDEDYRFRTQMNRVYMTFNPNSNNEFAVNVSESYTHKRDKYTTEAYRSNQKNKSTELTAYLDYLHSANRWRLEARVQYNYNPQNTAYMMTSDEPDYEYNTDSKSHNLSGMLEFTGHLLQPTATKSLDLYAGINGNSNWQNKIDTTCMYYTTLRDPIGFSTDRNTYYFSPYLKLETTLNKFRMQAIGQWQRYRYYLGYDKMDINNTYDKVTCDLTGSFMAEYDFTPHELLRFTASRNLDRPSETNLFPYKMYDAPIHMYRQGDPNLQPATSNELKIEYMGDQQWDEHKLLWNVAGSYIQVDDIINDTLIGGTSASGGGMIGLNQQYWSYANNGKNKIALANVLLMYTYRLFSVSLTGNVYNNHITTGEAKDHSTYYNISLFPTLSLRGGWKGSAKLTYYSKVKSDASTLSDQGTCRLVLGKEFNLGQKSHPQNLYVYLSGNFSMTGKAKDKTVNSDDAYTLLRYNMFKNNFGGGIRYSF